MTWVADSKGKLTVWKADGKGNPNKVGDNVTPDLSGVDSLLPSNGGKTKKLNVIDLSGTFDVRGFGLPPSSLAGKDPSAMTADDVAYALHRTALTNPDIWAGIQHALNKSNFYTSSQPTLGVWDQTTDIGGIKNFLEGAVTLYPASTGKPVPASQFLNEQENLAIKLGGNGVRNQIAKVTVPNELDLNYVFDKAFRAATGQVPTEKQLKTFARSYQSDILANARANAVSNLAARNPAATALTSTPIQTAPGAIAGVNAPAAQPSVTPPPGPSIAENYASAAKSPSVSVVSQPDVANVDVAATNFARKSAPAQAGSENISNALNAMFASLARNSQ